MVRILVVDDDVRLLLGVRATVVQPLTRHIAHRVSMQDLIFGRGCVVRPDFGRRRQAADLGVDSPT